MCGREVLQSLLRDVKTELAALFGDRLESLLLYGSYARGDQTEESDIDVFALIRLPREELARYRRVVSDLSDTLDLRYGVVLTIKLQDLDSFLKYRHVLPFFQNVEQEGIRVV